MPVKVDLQTQVRLAGLPVPALELRFHPERMWRWDLAWEPQHLAVEIQGGHFTGGRHTRGTGMNKDFEKYAAGLILGWRLLLVTTDHVRSGQALGWVEQLLREVCVDERSSRS